MQSEWLTDCDVNVLVRINGLPDVNQYDYQIGRILRRRKCLIKKEFVLVCKNGSCLLPIDRLSPFMWIYFRISVDSLSCLNNPTRGSIILQSVGE